MDSMSKFWMVGRDWNGECEEDDFCWRPARYIDKLFQGSCDVGSQAQSSMGLDGVESHRRAEWEPAYFVAILGS